MKNKAMVKSRGQHLSRWLSLLYNKPPTGTHAISLGVESTVRVIIAQKSGRTYAIRLVLPYNKLYHSRKVLR